MATRIRLRRVGRKKQAFFRIVVADGDHSRSGRITETIGKYNPRTQPSYVEIDESRALHWMRQGAQLSESVQPLFRKAGILKKFAEGADPEGVTVIGEPQGKTVLAGRAVAAAAEAAKPEKSEEKAEAKPKGKGKKKAEAPKAEEGEAEAKAEAEPEAQAESKKKGEADEEAEPEAEAEDEKE